MFKFIPCSIHNDTWSLVPDIMHNNIESSISSQAGPILFNPYLPHSSMLTGTPRMDGIAHESFYCNQPYAALTTTSPRHLQYATPVPQYPSPTSAPPMSLPSTAHTLYYNMSHVPGGSFPISRCSLIEAGTVGPTSPYSVVSACMLRYSKHIYLEFSIDLSDAMYCMCTCICTYVHTPASLRPNTYI